MLLKPEKLPSFTTSYRPISFISLHIKLFERAIDQRMCFHLEQIGLINKHQSGFIIANSTDDHLFRLSQSIMKSFNRGEHVVDVFLDIAKTFDNVWHNGLSYKIFSTKMIHLLSDFLVGQIILVNVNSFVSNKVNPKARAKQGSVLSPLFFSFMSMTFQHHTTNETFCSKTYATGPSKLGNVVCQMFFHTLIQDASLTFFMYV